MIRVCLATVLVLAVAVPTYARIHAAQSGRGLMHGYVDFEGVAYNDVGPTKTKARIELKGSTPHNHATYTTQTDERGSYDIKPIGMGEYTLKITSPGYRTYQTEILIPSDFECRLATSLKKVGEKQDGTPK